MAMQQADILSPYLHEVRKIQQFDEERILCTNAFHSVIETCALLEILTVIRNR